MGRRNSFVGPTTLLSEIQLQQFGNNIPLITTTHTPDKMRRVLYNGNDSDMQGVSK
jgi:hypothetical protein